MLFVGGTLIFPLTWPGHDAWQDPGFGWTPPLTLPPLAGAAGPGATPTDWCPSVPSPGDFSRYR